MFRIILLTLLVHIILFDTKAQPGTLDLNFSGDGKFIHSYSSSTDLAFCMKVQSSDQKIVIGGYTVIGGQNDFLISRVNVNGSLDNSFDSDGIATNDFFAGGDDKIFAMHLLPSGKILVAGSSEKSGTRRVVIARYNANGSLDMTFGANGTIGYVHYTINNQSEVRSIVVQSDDKIVVAGFTYVNDYDYLILRCNSNGSIDSSFNSIGYTITSIGSSGNGDDLAFDAALQVDGKIVITGRSLFDGNTELSACRYNPNGSLDSTFNSDGKFVFAYDNVSYEQANGVEIGYDGKICLGGFTSVPGNNWDFLLLRLNNSGYLDSTFNTTGVVTTDIGTLDDEGRAMVLQPDGKILLGGSSFIGADKDYSLLRYNYDGEVDVEFGEDGIVTTGVGSGQDEILGMDMQDDGRIVAAGYSFTGANADVSIVSYNNDLSVDWLPLLNGLNGTCRVLAIDLNNNLYAGGDFTTANGSTVNYIAKWDGVSWASLGAGLNGACYSLAVDSNNNVYAAGVFTQAGGTSANHIAKWNGSAWASLGSGINASASKLLVDENGDLYVGGDFTLAGGNPANYIAKWNGATWSTLGSGFNEVCRALAIDSSHNIYAGGAFSMAGGNPVNYLAKWDGSSWTSVGALNNQIYDLEIDNSNKLLAAGYFTNTNGFYFVGKWNGSVWEQIGSGFNDAAYTLSIAQNNTIFLGGSFTFLEGGTPAYRVAKWNGSAWSQIGTGMNHICIEFAIDSLSTLYAGGLFTVAGGISTNRIAKYTDPCNLSYDHPKQSCYYSLETIHYDSVCNPVDLSTKFATPSFNTLGSLTQYCDLNGADDDVWIQFVPKSNNTLIEINSNLPFGYQVIRNPQEINFSQTYAENNVVGCSSSSLRTYQLTSDSSYFIRIYSIGIDTFIDFSLCIKDVYDQLTICSHSSKVQNGTEVNLLQGLYYEEGLGFPSVYDEANQRFELGGTDMQCLGSNWINPSFHYFKADSTGLLSFALSSTTLSDSTLPFVIYGPFNSYPGDYFDNCFGSGCQFDSVLVCLPDYTINDTINIFVSQEQYYVFLYLNPLNLEGSVMIDMISPYYMINNSPISCFFYEINDCHSDNNLYSITATIRLNDLKPTSGYFILKDDRGSSRIYNAPFPEFIFDSLTNINADGQEHRLSFFFSEDATTRIDSNYIAPVACNSNPVSYYNPYFNQSSTAESGYTAGSMSVSDQGGMQYQIPILLPPGTAGVKPNISISYNSNAGDGIMGNGFTCDAMSFISRTGNTFDIDGWNLGVQLNDYDKLSINGERLIQTNASVTNGYLKSGAIYSTRNQSFTKYEAFGDPGEEPDYIIAYTKSGERMYFGNSSDSKVVGITGVTSFWLLKRVEDQYGNYFEYEYYNRIPNLSVPANEFYPIRIKYTGNALLAPYCRVEFTYTNRKTPLRPIENYSGGILQIATKKLSEIQVSYLDTIIKKYIITYDSSTISRLLRVRSIKECGMNGKCFEPTVFNWDENEVYSNFTLANRLALIPKSKLNNIETRSAQPDINGDGVIDFVAYNLELDSIYIFINRNGSFELFQQRLLSQFFSGITVTQVTNNAAMSQSEVIIDDLNGDNTPDFVFIHHPSGTNKITYTIANEDRSTVDFNMENGFANSTHIDNVGSELTLIYTADLDGNGLPELIAHVKSTGSNFFYTKVVDPTDPLQGFYQKSESLLIPIPQDKDIIFLDLNGDASTEIVWANYTPGQLSIVSNQLAAPLTHFFDPSDSLKSKTIQQIKNISATYATPPSIKFILFSEVNGDGLLDLLPIVSGALKFYINNGKIDFNERGSFNIPAGRTPILKDYNNDGRSDLIYYDVIDGHNTWFRNDGFNGLSGNIQFFEQYTDRIDINSVKGCPPTVLSFRSNSFSDIFFLNQCSPLPAERGTNYWWINDYKPSFKVNEIINGLGQRSKVIYSLTNDSTVYKPYISDIVFPSDIIYQVEDISLVYELFKIVPFEYTGRMPVVKEFQLDNGYDGVHRITYQFQKSVLDKSGAGFRGFSRVLTKDETSKLITVKKLALTTYGIMSEFENFTMFEGDNFPLNKTTSIDTILPKVYNITYTYSDSISVNHVFTSYFQYNQSSNKTNRDLDGSFASMISSFNMVDTFGNVIFNTIDYNDGFVDTLINTYNNNTSNWHLGRLTRSELHRGAPNTPSITRVSAFEYSPSKGALVKEIVEPDLSDTVKIEKTYTHDSFGNVISEKVRFFDEGNWKTRGSTIVYDVRGRFMVQSSNDLGHITMAGYNNLYGHKKSITDINGIMTRMYFDDFGRLIRTEGADSSWTETLYKRCMGNCPVQAVTYTIESNAIGRTSKSFFDKMGREVRSEETGFNGHLFITENAYNLNGYLIATTNPYFEGETPRWSSISYDKLGREIIREETGKSVTSKEYYGLGMKATNPLGQTRISYTYANGKIKEAIDNQGNILQFKYDAQGNTVKTILPTGDEIINEYNILSQNTKLIDPDLGMYRYRYNSIGEIKYQIDPKGNEVFMKYDTLGRLIERDELEDISYFTYDSASHGKGMLVFKGNKLTSSSTDYITSFTYAYDELTRPTSVLYKAEGDSLLYELSTEYDTLSRINKIIYPTINGEETRILYGYDAFGYSNLIRDDITNTIYWELDSITSQGQIAQYTIGNGDKIVRTYDTEFDWLKEIKTVTADDSIIQHLIYDYDFLGNVQWRKDLMHGMEEYFEYDDLNRLTEAHVIDHAPVQMQYDVLGNIISKTDLGTFHYNQNNEGPHVLSSIDLDPGKCVPSALTNFTLNSFNKVTNITSTHYGMDISYSIDKQRYRQQYYFNGQWLKQKDFILSVIEREKTVNGEKTTVYIKGSEGVVAAKYHLTASDSTFIHYWLKDHLGSLQTVVNELDSIVEVLSFDAWGQRRYADGSPMPVGTPNSFTNDRGYTGHEHLEYFDLINMNGRIYDPILGRFITPDPFVHEPFNIQSYNRYAYVLNNPLAYTDPSGYGFFKSFIAPFRKAIKRTVSSVKNIAQGQISQGLKDMSQASIYLARGLTHSDIINERGAKVFGKDNWNTVVVTTATIVVAAALTTVAGPIAAGAASGFVGGALGTILAGGDGSSALKAGLKGAAIGAVTAGLTAGVQQLAAGAGEAMNSQLAAYGTRVAGDGVVSGAMSEYQGGTFRSGMTSAVITSGLSPITGVLGSGKVERSMMSAAIGGTASDISGGKFFNGAASGALNVMFSPSTQMTDEERNKIAAGEMIEKMKGMIGKGILLADNGCSGYPEFGSVDLGGLSNRYNGPEFIAGPGRGTQIHRQDQLDLIGYRIGPAKFDVLIAAPIAATPGAPGSKVWTAIKTFFTVESAY